MADKQKTSLRHSLRTLLRLCGVMFVMVSHFFLFLLSRAVASKSRVLPVSLLWTQRWARWCVRAAGYTVTVKGPLPKGNCLLAPNHVGYGDIIVLASVAPCFFVAKSEVAGWPLIGWVMAKGNHLFVDRRKAKAMRQTAKRVQARLGDGYPVCVFLEGTSSGGGTVLPFRPSLLQPAIDVQAPVVPVALLWEGAGIDIAEDVAYWKDHHFATHIWRHLGLSELQVTVSFGEPILPAGRTRKELAETVRDEVVRLLASQYMPASGR
ncbi:MAG: 1-acyl-sn-glycerol-3-phosphate acyltransferase [Candidatus Pacebacteria bacterium]|nr:1-acyl-sn-glycerol-3-phosphate acyltransferase [Candidatus Paceibacterota bacterium]